MQIENEFSLEPTLNSNIIIPRLDYKINLWNFAHEIEVVVVGNNIISIFICEIIRMFSVKLRYTGDP